MASRSRKTTALRARVLLILSMLLAAPLLSHGSALQHEEKMLFDLANQARAEQHLAPLRWDPTLAAAARAHAQRMSQEATLSHRYPGEAELKERCGQTGAHFSLIEENIGEGTSLNLIHDGWLHSPGHRANLLNPRIDLVGVAVVHADGFFYAVTDFSQGVQVLSQREVEAKVGTLLSAQGIAIANENEEARAYCSNAHFEPSQNPPSYRMHWQTPELTQLPRELVTELASGGYRLAAVGSCPTVGLDGTFTAYRVGVLLYRVGSRQPF